LGNNLSRPCRVRYRRCNHRLTSSNYLFVAASYHLAEFENDVTSAPFGAVPAVVRGGVGTIIVMEVVAGTTQP
jgi:hypothetical protein